MSRELYDIVSEINALIIEAENKALETGKSFTLEPAYGMGGTFDPTDLNEDYDSHWWPSSLGC